MNKTAKEWLDEWNDITGFVVQGTSYYYELISIIEDAVSARDQEVQRLEEIIDSTHHRECSLIEQNIQLKLENARQHEALEDILKEEIIGGLHLSEKSILMLLVDALRNIAREALKENQEETP